MSDKPTYLGLLNAVALAEGRADTYLREWASRTPSADVRKVLLTVAARECEHAASFAKRINELGYELRDRDDGELGKAMAIVTSDRSDLEKMKALKLHRLDTGDKPDIFDGFFRNHTIDIRTGELLGRYIAEERDSARLLRSCYEQLKQAERAAPGGTGADVDDVADAIGTLEHKVDGLCRSVEELRQIVCAQSMPTSAS